MNAAQVEFSETKIMDEQEFAKLIPFKSRVISDICGYERQFTALDLGNNNSYHRSVTYCINEEFNNTGLWRYSEGCFDGYGETLEQAISELRNLLPKEETLCSFHAFNV